MSGDDSLVVLVAFLIVVITASFGVMLTLVRKVVQPEPAIHSSLQEDIPEINAMIEASEKQSKEKSAAEAAVRFDLAASHHLSAAYGFDELVWNHISARMEGPAFLVTPGDLHFDEVSPSNLIISSGKNANVTADVIHSAIYKARPDVGAIVHHHSTAVVAVSCMRSGFRYLTQDAAAFYGKVAHYDWEGVSDDYDECARIAAALGPTAHTLIMRNHGAVRRRARALEPRRRAGAKRTAAHARVRLVRRAVAADGRADGGGGVGALLLPRSLLPRAGGG